MQHEPEGFLYEVLEAAKNIESFLDGVTLETFLGSDLIRSAVERKFILIGEALSKLEKMELTVVSRLDDIRNIIGFRHQLVHVYRFVEPKRVYSIAQLDLPNLKVAVEELLRKAST
jgi:uncharacterized protein with HEPN domain